MPRATQTKAVIEEKPVAQPKSMEQLEQTRRTLVKEYTDQERVPVTLAPMYAAHFGNTLKIGLNGIFVSVRVDGSTQRIPEAFADEVDRRRMKVDEIIRRQRRMADIQHNQERSPGELVLY